MTNKTDKAIQFKVPRVVIKHMSYYSLIYNIALFTAILLQARFSFIKKPVNWIEVQTK